jgi:hypothetical protein
VISPINAIEAGTDCLNSEEARLRTPSQPKSHSMSTAGQNFNLKED